jgi:peptide deformylase
MAVLKIRKYGDPILRGKAERINEIDRKILKLSQDMLETMYAHEGVGLAANQIGVLKRIIVVDVSSQDPMYKPLILINPVIIEARGEEVFEEGCLSIPDVTADVVRPDHILVRALSPDEDEVEIEATGILARALQHEIDHLDGVLFVDRVPFMRRQLLKGQLKKLEQETLREMNEERDEG